MKLTEDEFSIYGAARDYGVPGSLLRDMTLSLVEPANYTPGPERQNRRNLH